MMKGLLLWVVVMLIGWVEPAAQPGNFLQALEEQQIKQFEQHFYEGLNQEAVGNWDAAAKAYEQALGIRPEAPAVKYRLARLYIDQKRWLKAAEYGRAATEKQPTNKWYYYPLIEALQGAGQYDAAVEAGEQLIEQAAEIDYKDYLLLAEQYAAAGDHQDAADICAEAETKLGYRDTVFGAQVEYWQRAGQADKAADAIEAQLKRRRLPVRYHKQLAEHYKSEGETEKAAAALTRMLELMPGNATAKLEAGRYFLTTDRAKGLRYLTEAFKDPGIEVSEKLPVLETVQDPKLRVDMADAILAAHPTAGRAYAVKAGVLQRKGRSAEAYKLYGQALDYDKSDYTVWRMFLTSGAERCDYQALMRRGEEALTVFPNQPEPYLYTALGYIRSGQYEKGLDLLAAGKLYALGQAPIEALFKLYEAEAEALKSGTYDQAPFEAARKTGEDAAPFRMSAAFAALHAGDLKSARNQLGEVTPDSDPFWLYLKASAALADGDLTGAGNLLQKAQAFAEPNGLFSELEGNIAAAKGDKIDALSAWNRAKELGRMTDGLKRKLNND